MHQSRSRPPRSHLAASFGASTRERVLAARHRPRRDGGVPWERSIHGWGRLGEPWGSECAPERTKPDYLSRALLFRPLVWLMFLAEWTGHPRPAANSLILQGFRSKTRKKTATKDATTMAAGRRWPPGRPLPFDKKRLSENAPKRLSQKASKRLSKNASKRLSEKASKRLSENAPERLSEKAPPQQEPIAPGGVIGRGEFSKI